MPAKLQVGAYRIRSAKVHTGVTEVMAGFAQQMMALVRKYAQPRCITFLRWQTSVNIERTVSTSIRSSHSPRGHSLRLAGSPSAAWKPVSLKTIIWSSHWRVVSLNARDGQIGNDGHNM